MSSWSDWAQALLALYPGYVRTPGAFSMTTNNELCMLDTWARYSYTGTGRIVDLGCWFGATTLALAEGLSRNLSVGQHAPIEAYDRFIWEDWMTPIAQHMGVPETFVAGDDFFPTAQSLLRSHESRVRLHRADLLSTDPGTQPIEFLFIDAMKSWPLADRIVRSFFPLLIPGRSIVVQQDFTHTAAITATNHIAMWLLRDQLKPVYHVAGSTSVLYFVEAPIDAASLPMIAPESFTAQQIDAAWEHSLSSITLEGVVPVRLCKIAFLLEQGYVEHAHREANAFAACGYRVPRVIVADARAAVAKQLHMNSSDPAAADLFRDCDRLLASCVA